MMQPKTLKRGWGITTGACATAAARSAVRQLLGEKNLATESVLLPDGDRLDIPVAESGSDGRATVQKYAGDDPDVTDGCLVVVDAHWRKDERITFEAGDGVGTVTKPGLSVPLGDPAINPGPRSMIERNIRELTSRGLAVRISVPGGKELAEKTFNPRLGIVGGISILGTTGLVRPYCERAFRDALDCTLDVAEAAGHTALVLVPGNIGMRAAEKRYNATPEQFIEAGNDWGYLIDGIAKRHFTRLDVVGHPGKLAKLAVGHWNTHSKRSESAVPIVTKRLRTLLGKELADSTTVEGVLASLDSKQASILSSSIAEDIKEAIVDRVARPIVVDVILINMKGVVLNTGINS